jgi:hypothetical protein
MTTAPVTHTPVDEQAPETRIPWRVAALVAGDAVSFVVFAGVGRTSHGEASGLAVLGAVVGTAVPFALGWFAVAPWLGVYRRALTEGALPMLRRTELAWVAAWPAACALRWALGPDHKLPFSFAVVILLANAVFLGAWRTVFAWATRRVQWYVRRGEPATDA